jgi:ferritin
MLSKKMQKALNEQINEELGSAYLYFAMSSWFKAQNLEGFASWLQVQAREETGHALKFYGYLHDQRADAELLALPAPKKSWKSALDAFEDTLKHEKFITGRINDLVTLAQGDKDNATLVLLHWFISEQVEEEATAQTVVDKLKMVAQHPGGVYLVDREMAARGSE